MHHAPKLTYISNKKNRTIYYIMSLKITYTALAFQKKTFLAAM
jgi:hypothetical protein